MVDSGASITVVSPTDCAVLRTLPETVPLQTSAGMTMAQMAVISTPIGEVTGLLSHGTPRLLPASLFAEFQAANFRQVTDGYGNRYGVRILPDGVPVLRLEPVAVAAVKRRRHRDKRDVPRFARDEPRTRDVPRRRRDEPRFVDLDEEDAPLLRDSGTSDSDDSDSESWDSDLEPRNLAFAAGRPELAAPAQTAPVPGLRRKPASKITHLPSCGCRFCRIAKMQRAPHKKGTEARGEDPLPRIVADLCTEYAPSFRGYTVLCVMKEVSSGFTFARPMRGKVNVSQCLLEMFTWLRDLSSTIIERFVFVSDYGGEFTSGELAQTIAQLGGTQLFVPRGRHVATAESAVRVVTGGIRTCILASGLPEEFWCYAASAFTYGINLEEVPWFYDALVANGTPVLKIQFGELAQAKLDQALRSKNKASPAAQPVAVMGLEWVKERRGLSVAYLTEGGKISATSIDVGPRGQSGILWGTERGESRMAFKAVFRELKRLVATVDSQDQDGFEPVSKQELEEWLERSGASAKPKPPRAKKWNDPIVPDRNSTCAACRGTSKKPHTRDQTCQKRGLYPPGSGPDGNVAAAAVPVSFKQTPLWVCPSDKGAEESLEAYGACLESVPWFSQGVSPTYPEKLKSGCPELLRGQFSSIAEDDRIHTAFQGVPLAQLECVAYAQALVTRKMTKEERSSDFGKDAHRKELAKLSKYGLFGRPVSRRSVKDGRATVCGLCMLSHVKGAEKSPEQQEAKGRCVVLGDQLKYVTTDLPIRHTEEFWTRLQSELVALEESRIIDCVALMFGWEIQSIDLESAYLQADWPFDSNPHFLSMPASLWKELPPHLLPDRISDPIWPMMKCGYGHPASGHLWIEVLLSYLLEMGWEVFGSAGSRALLRRESTLVGVYVDDVKATGPPDQLSRLWEDIRKRFMMKSEPATCREFLGLHYKMILEGIMRMLHVTQQEYAVATVLEFEKIFHEVAPPSRLPQVENIRPDELPEKTIPDRRNQVIIGRLLWLCRCTRPDLSCVTSELGSRVACWDESCHRAMTRVIGYLKVTSAATLTYTWPNKEVDPRDIRFECHSDSDWEAPRSQSGMYACLTIEGVESALLPVHWLSKRQTVTADSSATAEIVATHVASKAGVPVLERLLKFVSVTQGVKTDELSSIDVLLDNSTALGHGTKPSSAFVCLAKAFRVRLGWIRDCVQSGVFRVKKVASAFNRADPGTKRPKDASVMLTWAALLGIVLPAGWHDPKHRRDAWINSERARVATQVSLASPIDVDGKGFLTRGFDPDAEM